MTLGLTQSLTEMSIKNLPGGKGQPARKADNLTATCEPTVWKMGKPQRLTTLWVSMACYKDSHLTLLFIHLFYNLLLFKFSHLLFFIFWFLLLNLIKITSHL
jgi:hypothetical protein